jgi:hypothetical protein
LLREKPKEGPEIPSCTGLVGRLGRAPKLSDPARNVRDVIAMPFELPVEVFDLPGDERLDVSRWNGQGVPATVVLSWIEDGHISSSTVGLLEAIDGSELAPADLPRLLKAWDRVESHAAAKKAMALAQLAHEHRGFRGWDDQEPTANEASVALRLPLHQAQAEVHRTKRLHTHLPQTLGMWLDGLITAAHVRKMVAATSRLGQDKCAQVEEIVLPGAESLSVSEFKQKVARAVARVHPRDLNERHRDAAKEADVTMCMDDDGIGWITANMPGVDAVVVKAAVDAYAAARKKAGDQRPLGVLRAQGLRMMCEAYLNGQLTGRAPTVHGRPVTINICATPAALLGLTDTPGEIPGVGPVPIETIREMAHEAQLRWMTISETDGSLIDYVPTTYRLNRRLHEFIDAKYVASVGPHSTTPAARTDGEHLIPHGSPGGFTTPENAAPMDRGWHNAKTHLGFKVQRQPDGSITWTTPLGQTYTVYPYDYRLGP